MHGGVRGRFDFDELDWRTGRSYSSQTILFLNHLNTQQNSYALRILDFSISVNLSLTSFKNLLLLSFKTLLLVLPMPIPISSNIENIPSTITIFGVKMRRLRQVLSEQTDEEKVYTQETVHGYKCRNLLQAHDKRKQELIRRTIEPNSPHKRIQQANYNTTKLPKIPSMPNVAEAAPICNEEGT
jgi:ABC-type siderophore export system fused ATPase/permease subunit